MVSESGEILERLGQHNKRIDMLCKYVASLQSVIGNALTHLPFDPSNEWFDELCKQPGQVWHCREGQLQVPPADYDGPEARWIIAPDGQGAGGQFLFTLDVPHQRSRAATIGGQIESLLEFIKNPPPEYDDDAK